MHRRSPKPSTLRVTVSAWLVAASLGLGGADLARATEPERVDVQAEITSLQRADTDALRLASLDRLARATGTEASSAVCVLLNAGQSDAVTDRALELLGKIGASTAHETLAVFARHRRAAARVRAYAALARLQGPATHALIAQGLRDAAPEVRARAAQALAETNARDQLEALFLALTRGVPEAAASLGALGDSNSIARLKPLIGKVGLDAMLRGYQPLLCRADIGEADKLSIVATLEDVSGEVVHAFLRRVSREPSCKKSVKLERALQASIKRTQKPSVADKAPGAQP